MHCRVSHFPPKNVELDLPFHICRPYQSLIELKFYSDMQNGITSRHMTYKNSHVNDNVRKPMAKNIKLWLNFQREKL